MESKTPQGQKRQTPPLRRWLGGLREEDRVIFYSALFSMCYGISAMVRKAWGIEYENIVLKLFIFALIGLLFALTQNWSK